MIYTVTLNPSLDYVMGINSLQTGLVNRCTDDCFLPGGKGLNISIVLNNLDTKSIALGFVAGFTGDKICSMLDEMGCNHDFVRLNKGDSRINVKLKCNEVTEINAAGPMVNENELNDFLKKIDKIENGDTLILSGSIPKGLPKNIYELVIQRLSKRDVMIIVDAERELLNPILPLRPFLIKPNHCELGEIFNCEINEIDEVVEKSRILQSKGARNVLVSLADKGAVLVNENGEVMIKCAPKGTVKNSVGAGDSMIAGFVYSYLQNFDFQKSFDYSIATGSASAFSDELAKRNEIEDLLKTI